MQCEYHRVGNRGKKRRRKNQEKKTQAAARRGCVSIAIEEQKKTS